MSEIEKLAFSPTEAASALGLCQNTIYKMVKRGRIKSVKVERKILIPRAELIRLLSGQSDPPAAGGATT